MDLKFPKGKTTWEGGMHDCEMLSDSTEEAYVDGLNFVIAEYIEPENYAFSKN